jgi:hypothetical protein
METKNQNQQSEQPINQLFEENGVQFEKVIIDLQKILDFYRLQCFLNNLQFDAAETLIAIDVSKNIETMVEGSTAQDWTKFFNLQDAFANMTTRENTLTLLKKA